MRFRYVGSLLSAATAAALLAGCSGGGGSPAAVGSSGSGSTSQSIAHLAQHNYSVLPAKIFAKGHPSAVKQIPFVNVHDVMYPQGDQTIVSDYANNTVTVFGGAGKVNALLTSGILNPQGMTTDSSGTLYVANTGNSNLLVYPKPYTSATTTYNDSGWYPTDVALASDGTVAAANIFSTSFGAGSVTIFAKGSTSPCATITDSNWSSVYFEAFDKSGNLYIDGHDLNGNTIVGEVTGECSATGITPLTTGNFISFPGGVQVLNNGDIAIDDQSGFAVYTYAPPSGGSLGSPVQTTSLSGVGDAVTFAIKSHDQNLWVADAAFLDAAKYAYPAGGSSIKTYTGNFGQPIGVAVNPAQP